MFKFFELICPECIWYRNSRKEAENLTTELWDNFCLLLILYYTIGRTFKGNSKGSIKSEMRTKNHMSEKYGIHRASIHEGFIFIKFTHNTKKSG